MQVYCNLTGCLERDDIFWDGRYQFAYIKFCFCFLPVPYAENANEIEIKWSAPLMRNLTCSFIASYLVRYRVDVI